LVEWSEDEEVVGTHVLVPLRLREEEPKLREEPRLNRGKTTRGPGRIIGVGIGESGGTSFVGVGGVDFEDLVGSLNEGRREGRG
jgi:hypothetical protein